MARKAFPEEISEMRRQTSSWGERERENHRAETHLKGSHSQMLWSVFGNGAVTPSWTLGISLNTAVK